MRCFSTIIQTLLTASVLLFAFAGKAVADNTALAAGHDKIGDGERLLLKDGDISIVPPTGWEVFTAHPSLTLLMQVPHDPSLKYQRTIQVASFSGKKYIDEVTAREYEQVIVRKFSQLSSSIEDYKVREFQLVDMADGRDGILIYTEFKLEGVDMMQAHILVSSEKRHYLMTFTDLADHFEKEEYSQFLNEAWSSMISVELAGGGGASVLKALGLGAFKRFQTLIFISMGVFGAGFLLLLLSMIRKRFVGNRYGAFMGDGGRDDYEPTGEAATIHPQSTGMSNITQHSRAAVSQVSQAFPTNLSQPVGSIPHSAQRSTKGPLTNVTQQESHFKTATEAGDDLGMDTFFGVDEDEDDKAI